MLTLTSYVETTPQKYPNTHFTQQRTCDKLPWNPFADVINVAVVLFF